MAALFLGLTNPHHGALEWWWSQKNLGPSEFVSIWRSQGSAPNAQSRWNFSLVSWCHYIGFWQIPLAKDYRHLTTFITPFGRYCFNKLPFGIISAPELFQKQMKRILEGLQVWYARWMTSLCLVPTLKSITPDCWQYFSDYSHLMLLWTAISVNLTRHL